MSDELFIDDYMSVMPTVTSILVKTEPLYAVILYSDAKTVGILTDRATPGFIEWFTTEISEGRWIDGGCNPMVPGRHFDRAGGLTHA